MIEQTAIAGQVQTEINCLPVENKDYRPIMDEILRLGQKPKRETKFYTGNISTHGGNLLVPGTLGASGTFSTFIVGLISTVFGTEDSDMS